MNYYYWECFFYSCCLGSNNIKLRGFKVHLKTNKKKPKRNVIVLVLKFRLTRVSMCI